MQNLTGTAACTCNRVCYTRGSNLNRESPQPGKLLSLSFWRDEAAISAWRNLELHRSAQRAGRDHLFRDYRLRVGEVIRDYSLEQRASAPADSQLSLLKSDA